MPDSADIDGFLCKSVRESVFWVCNSLKMYCPQVAIVGQVTIGGEVNPVKFVLLEGELAIPTDDCGMAIQYYSKLWL